MGGIIESISWPSLLEFGEGLMKLEVLLLNLLQFEAF